MEYLNASGHDFEGVASAIENNFDLPPVVMSPSDETFFWSFKKVSTPTLSLSSSTYLADLGSFLGGGDEILIGSLRSGQLTIGSGRTTFQVSPKIPFILPYGPDLQLGRAVDLSVNYLHLNRDLLATIALEVANVSLIGVSAALPTSAAASVAWLRMVDLIASVIWTPGSHASPLLTRELSRLAAIALLDTFPYDSVTAGPSTRGPEPGSVRRAYEFVHDNAHRPIDTADIATAAGLSIRSLQYALSRYRETTPRRMLQDVRLDLVRRELLSSDPRVTSIAGTARDWGFAHLGRFAGAYRARFGESPNESLRRSSPPPP